MRGLTRPQIAALALEALENGDTRVLAAKYRRQRSSIYRYLSDLCDQDVLERRGECAYSKGAKWSKWFDGIDSGRWDAPNSHESGWDYLAGASTSGILRKPTAPRLADDFRLENGREEFELMSLPVPAEFLRFLRPLSRDKAGNVRTWAGEIHYGKYGTAQFHVGADRATVQLEMRRQWIPDARVAEDPGAAVAYVKKAFQTWAREIERDYGLRLTLRGVPIPDPKKKGQPNTMPTGELEKSVLGVDLIGKAPITSTSQSDDSPPGPSVSTVSLGDEARNLAKAAMSGGLEGILARLDRLEAETAKGFDRLATIVERLLPKPEAPGPAPPADDKRGYG